MIAYRARPPVRPSVGERTRTDEEDGNIRTVATTVIHLCMGNEFKVNKRYVPRCAHALFSLCLTKWPTLGDIFGYL